MPSNRELSAFLLRACHDLRSSVRAIRAHAELLIRDAEKIAQPGFAERAAFIAGGVRQIDAMAEGLAGYAAALSTDPGSFQQVRTDVLLRTVLARIEKPLREAGGEITYDELPAIRGNPDRVVQLFEQLLRNVIAHRGEKAPRARVSAARSESAWTFSIRDEGPGVEGSELERIFAPFERLHRGEGPGLGLAACKAIVEAHGGRIWAEAGNDGAGLTVFFTVPE